MFGGDHDDGLALCRQLVHQLVDLALGAHVDAAGRLVEDQHVAVAQQPLGQMTTFCWLPPERLPTRARGGRRFDADLFDVVLRVLCRPCRRRTNRGRGTAAPGWAGPYCPPRTARGTGRSACGPRRDSRCRSGRRPSGVRILASLPFTRMTPASIGSAPQIRRIVSVRPAPTRPAKPRISPLCSWNETSFTSSEHRCSASSTTGASGGHMDVRLRLFIDRHGRPSAG